MNISKKFSKKISKTKSFVACVLLIGGALIASTAPASAFFERFFGGEKKAEVKEVYTIHDAATFAANTQPYHVIPFSDPKLEFEITLPKDWEMEKLTLDDVPDLNKEIAGDIARFQSPYIGTSKAYVIVQAVQIKYDIAAKDWLKSYILGGGAVPEGDIVEVDVHRAQGEYIIVNPDSTTSHIYVVAQQTGSLVTVVKFIVPLRMREYLGFLQKKGADSFRMSYVNDAPIERSKVFTLVDAIKFNYPDSWTITSPDMKDSDRLSVQVIYKTPFNTVEGYVRFLAVRRNIHTSLKVETDAVKKYLTESLKLFPSEMKSSDDIKDISSRFIFRRAEKYVVEDERKTTKQDLRFVVLGDKEWYVFAIMLSQPEQVDLKSWARNQRTFDLILQSLK